MKIIYPLRTVFILPFVLLGVIIMVPIRIIGDKIDIAFFRSKRMQRFFDDLKNNWIPLKKYIYFYYDEHDGNYKLNEFIKKELLPKYNKYMVVDNPVHLSNTNPFKKSAHILYTEYGENYYGQFEAILIIIGKNIKIQSFYPPHREKGNSLNLEGTKELFTEKIEECLEEWGVRI